MSAPMMSSGFAVDRALPNFAERFFTSVDLGGITCLLDFGNLPGDLVTQLHVVVDPLLEVRHRLREWVDGRLLLCRRHDGEQREHQNEQRAHHLSFLGPVAEADHDDSSDMPRRDQQTGPTRRSLLKFLPGLSRLHKRARGQKVGPVRTTIRYPSELVAHSRRASVRRVVLTLTARPGPTFNERRVRCDSAGAVLPTSTNGVMSTCRCSRHRYSAVSTHSAWSWKR